MGRRRRNADSRHSGRLFPAHGVCADRDCAEDTCWRNGATAGNRCDLGCGGGRTRWRCPRIGPTAATTGIPGRPLGRTRRLSLATGTADQQDVPRPVDPGTLELRGTVRHHRQIPEHDPGRPANVEPAASPTTPAAAAGDPGGRVDLSVRQSGPRLATAAGRTQRTGNRLSDRFLRTSPLCGPRGGHVLRRTSGDRCPSQNSRRAGRPGGRSTGLRPLPTRFDRTNARPGNSSGCRRRDASHCWSPAPGGWVTSSHGSGGRSYPSGHPGGGLWPQRRPAPTAQPTGTTRLRLGRRHARADAGSGRGGGERRWTYLPGSPGHRIAGGHLPADTRTWYGERRHHGRRPGGQLDPAIRCVGVSPGPADERTTAWSAGSWDGRPHRPGRRCRGRGHGTGHEATARHRPDSHESRVRRLVAVASVLVSTMHARPATPMDGACTRARNGTRTDERPGHTTPAAPTAAGVPPARARRTRRYDGHRSGDPCCAGADFTARRPDPVVSTAERTGQPGPGGVDLRRRPRPHRHPPVHRGTGPTPGTRNLLPARFDARSEPTLGGDLTAAGHEVAVHGWTHRNLLLRGPAATYRDLARTRDLIGAVTGRTPRFFRPPYGVLSTASLVAARRLRLTPVLWTCWGRDWSGTATVDSVLGHLAAGLSGGGTILLHDSDCASAPGSWRASLAALPYLLDQCARRGWSVGPLVSTTHLPAPFSAPTDSCLPAGPHRFPTRPGAGRRSAGSRRTGRREYRDVAWSSHPSHPVPRVDDPLGLPRIGHATRTRNAPVTRWAPRAVRRIRPNCRSHTSRPSRRDNPNRPVATRSVNTNAITGLVRSPCPESAQIPQQTKANESTHRTPLAAFAQLL